LTCYTAAVIRLLIKYVF